MNPPVGGEVQGKLSAVAFLSLLRAKADQAGGEDLADLARRSAGVIRLGSRAFSTARMGYRR